MATLQHPQPTGGSAPAFRLDVELHDLLRKPATRPMAPPAPSRQPETLPEPLFPERPELLVDDGSDEALHETAVRSGRRHWTFRWCFAPCGAGCFRT